MQITVVSVFTIRLASYKTDNLTNNKQERLIWCLKCFFLKLFKLWIILEVQEQDQVSLQQSYFSPISHNKRAHFGCSHYANILFGLAEDAARWCAGDGAHDTHLLSVI